MRIESFDLEEGEVINGKYEILQLLGKGWEGEVYLVMELSTGIERTAKFFFPHRNKYGRTSRYYAKKLHKLRNCGIVIQYHFQDLYFIQGTPITYLISEFIEGELLEEYIKRQPGKKLPFFDALHLLYALADGIETIHALGEYHGDLHTENVMVNRYGLGFEVKILDLINLGGSNAHHKKEDIVDLIELFYETLGGRKQYSKLPQQIKDICCGLKQTLILKKFPTITKLKEHLDNIEWD